MNRYDRVIALSFLGFFFGTLLVLAVLFIAVDGMSLLNGYNGVQVSTVLQYYSYAVFEIFYRMLPVAVLIASVMTLTQIQRAHELTALLSLGMSFQRIILPIVLLCVFFCGVEFYLGDALVPRFTREKEFIFYHDIKKEPTLYSIVKTDRIWYRSKDTIFNIKTLNENDHRAQGLTLYSFDAAWNLVQMIQAQEVELQGSTWLLKNGSVTLFSKDSSFPQTQSFENKSIVMGEDTKDLTSTGNTSDILSTSELHQYIEKNKAAGLDTARYEVNYESKFSFALTALVMIFLGIPFSLAKTRNPNLMAKLGVCLVIIFVYWVFYSSFLTLGQYGQLPPFIAAWTPNVTSAIFGMFMINRSKL